MSSFSDLPSLLPFHLAYFSAEQLQNVERYFGSLEHALSASQSDWQACQIAKEKQLEGLFNVDLARRVDEALAWAEQPQHSLIGLGSDGFPALLK